MMQRSEPVVASAQDKSRFIRLRRNAPVYLGFAATGVGVALPGAVLPVLLTRWHLGDEQGGRLLLMAWIGSSIGALMVARALRTSLFLGSTAVAVAAVALSFCAGWLADGAMLLYGVGLGITMTAISILCEQESRHSGRELVRLNLLWAAGACACPALTIRSLTSGDLRPLLYSLAVLFALLAVWALSQPTVKRQPAKPSAASPWAIFSSVPWGLIVLVMLITGVEASAGGWLTTYAKRGGDPLSQIIAAPTCLWAGLLLSRLFWSFTTGAANGAWVVRGSLLLMGAASGLLLASHHGWPLLLAAGCLGFGIGPTYPLLLAWALRIHPGGVIFFLAGVGSACLPWLTGFVSTRRGSLHAGLGVPAVATFVMIAISLTLPLAAWNRANAPRS